MGEGWHNNHHACQSSVRQGFHWWQIDFTYYILLGLSKLRIVHDMKSPPLAVLRNEHRLGARIINKAAADVVATFNIEQIAARVNNALAHLPHASDLRGKLADAQHRAADVLAGVHVPHLPTREEVSTAAANMLARTPSLDDVIDRAYALLLEKVGQRVCAGV